MVKISVDELIVDCDVLIVVWEVFVKCLDSGEWLELDEIEDDSEEMVVLVVMYCFVKEWVDEVVSVLKEVDKVFKDCVKVFGVWKLFGYGF